jgi:hypothetical protein
MMKTLDDQNFSESKISWEQNSEMVLTYEPAGVETVVDERTLLVPILIVIFPPMLATVLTVVLIVEVLLIMILVLEVVLITGMIVVVVFGEETRK